MAKSSPFSFLWQALHLPSKNPKLFANVVLIYILSHGLLYISFLLSIAPLTSKLTELAKSIPTIDPSSPEFTELINTIKAVTKEFLIFEIIYYVFLFVISCFLSIITYYANSATYLGEMLTLKDVLKKVKSIIKGPLITHLFASLFTLVYFISLAVIIFAVSSYFKAYNSNISSWFWQIPLILFGSLLLVYLSIIWSMGVAISVIKPNLYGIGAISHATKLLKGKKMQVFLLIFALIITSGILHVGNFIIMKFAPGSKAGSWVLGFVYQLLLQAMNFYTMMAITVLYYECNQSIGDQIEYTKLSTASIV
ncbi:transmembrane protein [Rhynchospora pubera]|uniref:Transmembrane protein n=1 Tax=Rhynchospora pubera TaxID=906938 RepID=A0AAV8CKG3_9POAL|nr:transmembrane protein [Rhynchospora pubera]